MIQIDDDRFKMDLNNIDATCDEKKKMDFVELPSFEWVRPSPSVIRHLSPTVIRHKLPFIFACP
jgi:hypothetical protein